MRKRILFRADGDQFIGLGHLYRLFALAEMLKGEYDFSFVTKKTSTASVFPEKYSISFIPDDISLVQEPDWLSNNFSPLNHIIIADGYQFNSGYQKQIKKQGFPLIYIDDFAKEHMFADVVVNHSPHIQKEHFKKEAYTRLALGTQYALLRPLFLKETEQNKTIDIIDRAFVCFGGADPYNLTLKAVKALLKTSDFEIIHVVLGGAYKHQEIFDVEEKYTDNVKIHQNLSEEKLLKTMQQCNFAIAAASTILYELCCVKMPVLSGYYVDNQVLIYKGFANRNAIYKGDNMKDYKISDFVDKINAINAENKFNNQIEAQKRLFDNKIASRHLNLIKELC